MTARITQEYDVLVSEEVIHLTIVVDSFLNDGWRLVGGVSFGDGFYMQAVTRTVGKR